MDVYLHGGGEYPLTPEAELAVLELHAGSGRMTWLNREYFCNLYVGRVLIGQISRWDSAGQGWRGFLLDNGRVTGRMGWFATPEEARAKVEARALSTESAVA